MRPQHQTLTARRTRTATRRLAAAALSCLPVLMMRVGATALHQKLQPRLLLRAYQVQQPRQAEQLQRPKAKSRMQLPEPLLRARQLQPMLTALSLSLLATTSSVRRPIPCGTTPQLPLLLPPRRLATGTGAAPPTALCRGTRAPRSRMPATAVRVLLLVAAVPRVQQEEQQEQEEELLALVWGVEQARGGPTFRRPATCRSMKLPLPQLPPSLLRDLEVAHMPQQQQLLLLQWL